MASMGRLGGAFKYGDARGTWMGGIDHTARTVTVRASYERRRMDLTARTVTVRATHERGVDGSGGTNGYRSRGTWMGMGCIAFHAGVSYAALR